MYTTLYFLENAENIHELKLKSREEIELYKRLKEIAKARGVRVELVRGYHQVKLKKFQLMKGCLN
jgi:uncharacterized protein